MFWCCVLELKRGSEQIIGLWTSTFLKIPATRHVVAGGGCNIKEWKHLWRHSKYSLPWRRRLPHLMQWQQMGEDHRNFVCLTFWKNKLRKGRDGGGLKAPRKIITIKVSLSHDCFLFKKRLHFICAGYALQMRELAERLPPYHLISKNVDKQIQSHMIRILFKSHSIN